MAMIITLNWTPAGGTNSQNQDVQYRVHGAVNWITFATVGPAINTYQVTGLQENILYDFQVVDNCVYGGPVPSAMVTEIKIGCPTPLFSNTHNTVEFAFNHLGGDIDQYVVRLLDTGNALLATQTITIMAPVITGSFTGVTSSTNYQLQVVPSAVGKTRTCAAVATSTPAPPVCEPPTNVTATLN